MVPVGSHVYCVLAARGMMVQWGNITAKGMMVKWGNGTMGHDGGKMGKWCRQGQILAASFFTLIYLILVPSFRLFLY